MIKQVAEIYISFEWFDEIAYAYAYAYAFVNSFKRRSRG